jgi:hypothetical protein
MFLKKLKWSLFRLLAYVIVLVNFVTFGAFLYVIAPFTSYFFFNDLRFWKYWSFYRKFYVNTFSYLKAIWAGDSALLISHLPLSAPPMDSPDTSVFRVSPNWNTSKDNCGSCSACCTLTSDCCFRDKTTNLCLSYKSVFWKFFNCGRFPISKDQLDYYGCKKFETVDAVKSECNSDCSRGPPV